MPRTSSGAPHDYSRQPKTTHDRHGQAPPGEPVTTRPSLTSVITQRESQVTSPQRILPPFGAASGV